MIVAMRWRWQALRARDRDLKHSDAARRVFPGDQEAHREKPDSDGLVRRIDVEVYGLLCHGSIGKRRLRLH